MRNAYLLEIEGLFTQGSRPGRTVGESVGGILEMDSSDWSNGIRYHIIDTRPDNEFKVAVNSLGEPLFRLVFAASSLHPRVTGRRRRQGDGGGRPLTR